VKFCKRVLYRLKAFFSRTTLVSRHQKDKPFSGGGGISWTICKSFAPRGRQITTPVPHRSVFTGRMPVLPHSQQRQSTDKA